MFLTRQFLQPPVRHEERFSYALDSCQRLPRKRSDTERGLARFSDCGTKRGQKENDKDENNCAKVTLGLVALCVLIGLMAVSGCGEGSGDDSIGAIVGLVPPPVSVTFRESLMKGYVLQLHNRSSNRITARVYVENKLLNQSKSVAVGIAPNEMNELGILEMDWAFMPGGKWSSFCRRIYKRNIF